MMQIVKLSRHNSEAIIDLQRVIVQNLADPSLYYELTPQEVMDMLASKGLCLGIFDFNKRLIAYAAMRFPGANPDNLGIDMNLKDGELVKVAHIEAGLVHPEFRGQGLQKLLYREAVRQTRAIGRFRYLYSTVACHNYPALANSLALNLLIADLKIKYSGYLRYVLFQDWEQPLLLDLDKPVQVDSRDIEKQRVLIETGFYGYRIESQQGNRLIYYAKAFYN